MRKLLKRLVAVLIISAGVIMFNYPTIATFVNNVFANREISEYQEAASGLDEEELNREIALAQAYNQSLPMSFPADPFSGSSIRDFTGTEFENFDLVQPGTMIGYIEIPNIDVYQPIYYGTSDEVLDKGLGLVENTSLPVGGPGTHAVISGHTGMATRKLFTDLTEMKNGDLFFIHVLNQHFAYQVDQILVVLPEETEALAIQKGLDLVTLVTCTPFGINDHRLLVRGARVDYDFGSETGNQGLLRGHLAWLKWIASLGAGLLFIILLAVKAHRDHKRDMERSQKAAKKRDLAENKEGRKRKGNSGKDHGKAD